MRLGKSLSTVIGGPALIATAEELEHSFSKIFDNTNQDVCFIMSFRLIDFKELEKLKKGLIKVITLWLRDGILTVHVKSWEKIKCVVFMTPSFFKSTVKAS